mgnify:CR=1 FL=1
MIGQSDMTKEKRNTYTAGIYCRLSNDDEDNEADDTSVSINTQKQICTDFCHRNGIRVYDIFVDDGWTGTNFERPDFRRLIKAVEDGKINAVVVKDLSRLAQLSGNGELHHAILPAEKRAFHRHQRRRGYVQRQR